MQLKVAEIFLPFRAHFVVRVNNLDGVTSNNPNYALMLLCALVSKIIIFERIESVCHFKRSMTVEWRRTVLIIIVPFLLQFEVWQSN
jgi:hypothetical protein